MVPVTPAHSTYMQKHICDTKLCTCEIPVKSQPIIGQWQRGDACKTENILYTYNQINNEITEKYTRQRVFLGLKTKGLTNKIVSVKERPLKPCLRKQDWSKNLFHLIPIQRDMVWAQVRMQKLALLISTSKGLISLICNGQFVKLTAT